MTTRRSGCVATEKKEMYIFFQPRDSAFSAEKRLGFPWKILRKGTNKEKIGWSHGDL